MTREEKAKIIESLSQKFAEHMHFYIADASGMSVAEVNDFRRLCYKNGLEYGVYKNTLIQKALEKLEGTDYSPIYGTLVGFSGVLFSKEVGNLPARVLKDVSAKLNGRPVLKVASIDTEFYIGADKLKALSELKSKNEILGEVISMLQSPVKNVLSALQSGKHTLAGLVKTLEERKQN